ncbi:class I SAM-dependent methyltransferase [Solihabitans fulvus]|uniref:Class I SAM-dependent methyltransferase n=1 Tax=Solihabitans fulvus TaxID=1892852 RepID=A0A5B2WQT1_9PSEU|nr:class I SAM-dependent methyltransferase [Solihabitans fulvus]KAA2253865.1 class I SAM-dependent methyltransferase [Solihabitans fulvus]
MFDEQYWEERYGSSTAVWSGRPNSQLVADVADLAPGTALDAGCGEGADSIWLAVRGWRVTAVDFATAALRRAEEHAEAFDQDAAARISWVRRDLLTAVPPVEGTFDLVSAQFMQFPPEQRGPLFAGLAVSVAPGGTLLIVGHHPVDLETTSHRPPVPEMFYSAEEIADSLDPERWEILAADTRPRLTNHAEGRETTIHDAVLRARRRP